MGVEDTYLRTNEIQCHLSHLAPTSLSQGDGLLFTVTC